MNITEPCWLIDSNSGFGVPDSKGSKTRSASRYIIKMLDVYDLAFVVMVVYAAFCVARDVMGAARALLVATSASKPTARLSPSLRSQAPTIETTSEPSTSGAAPASLTEIYILPPVAQNKKALTWATHGLVMFSDV